MQYNVLVWGTGRTTKEYYKTFTDKCKIVGFIDSYKTEPQFYGLPLYAPEEIKNISEWDYILVCTISIYAVEIKQKIIELGLDLSKVIFAYNLMCADGSGWEENPKLTVPISNLQNENILNELSPELQISMNELVQVADKMVFAAGFPYNHSDPCYDRGFLSDFFRFRTFELMADLINKEQIAGDVAEFGVFQGTFAREINRKFPERNLYLFDTFKSFSEEEYILEMEKGNQKDRRFFEYFTNTSIALVMSRMQNPQRCIIKEGLFPATTAGLEDKNFAFVSIDVDFEESTLAGLEFFYPRLMEGGCIFIHDGGYQGIWNAVRRYEEQRGKKLKKLPMADSCGTIVLLK